MLGPQTEVEIRIWCDEVARSMGGLRQDSAEDAMQRADDLLADYRTRYEQPQPAADDRLGRAAIEAMDAIIGEMRQERDDTDTLTIIEQQEMSLWRESYRCSRSFDHCERARDADAAVAQFRLRYSVEPAAPPAVWYDEPPFPKDAATRPCWIAGSGHLYPAVVYWGGRTWRVYFPGDQNAVDLDGRRVSPIHKPQEPTT